MVKLWLGLGLSGRLSYFAVFGKSFVVLCRSFAMLQSFAVFNRTPVKRLKKQTAVNGACAKLEN